MEFGKRHDTTDTTDFYLRQLVTARLVADLSFMLSPVDNVDYSRRCGQGFSD